MTDTQVAVEKITKDMFIADVVEQYPSSAEILVSYGIHCVGCGVSKYESLYEGLSGHGGFDDAMIETIIKELNEAIPEEDGDPGELTITTKAVAKLKQIKQEHKKLDMGLRVLVQSGGCSGYSYGFEFTKDANEDDEVIEIDDEKFFIDAQSFVKLKGAKIDYMDSLQGAGFTITNPNAKRTCGCGKSFA